MVHLSHDVGSTLVVACEVAEEGSCDCHIERCRHSLASHVADDEEEFVALDDEVVEVASHLLGRCHRGKEIEVLSLWEGRRDHPHLDVVGNLQLALQAFLAGRCRLEFVDVLLQRVLHILKRVSQLLQLVL